MKLNLKLLFVIITSSFVSIAVLGQGNNLAENELMLRLNLSGAYNVTDDTPEFERLDGMRDCCEGYRPTVGNGLIFSFETGLVYKVIDLSVGIGYGTNLTSFYGETSDPVLNANREDTIGIFSHNLETERSFLLPSISLGINPVAGLRIYGGGGMFMHQEASYDYIEKLESPEGGVFAEENSRARNPQNGEIININDPIFLFAGVSYELPLTSDDGLYLVPFVEFTSTQDGLLSTKKWSHFNYSAGLGITYRIDITPREDIYRKSVRDSILLDTVYKSGPLVSNRMDGKLASGVVSNYTSTDTLQKNEHEFEIVTTNFFERTDTIFEKKSLSVDLELDPDFLTIPLELYTENVPILPYLFFEKNSTLLNVKQGTDRFWYEEIVNHGSRHRFVYENLLTLLTERIIGSGGKITLTGYIDPKSENNCELALSRAEAVRGMLLERGVADGSIIVTKARTANCAPKSMAKSESEAAYQENRRVEISTSNPELLESYLIKGTPRVVAVSKDPIRAKFNVLGSKELSTPAVDVLAAIKLGTIIGSSEFEQVAETINYTGEFSLEPRLESGQVYIDYNGGSEQVIIGEDTGVFSLNAELQNGETLEDAEELWIKYDTSSVSKSRVSIVLFPVGKSDITVQGKKEIAAYASQLEKNSVLSVMGFADSIGEEEKNAKLAKARAQAVIEYLNAIRPDLDASYTETSGKPQGITSFLTPQERLLSRTVQIEADLK